MRHAALATALLSTLLAAPCSASRTEQLWNDGWLFHFGDLP
jgi:hypothetical protein